MLNSDAHVPGAAANTTQVSCISVRRLQIYLMIFKLLIFKCNNFVCFFVRFKLIVYISFKFSYKASSSDVGESQFHRLRYSIGSYFIDPERMKA